MCCEMRWLKELLLGEASAYGIEAPDAAARAAIEGEMVLTTSTAETGCDPGVADVFADLESVFAGCKCGVSGSSEVW